MKILKNLLPIIVVLIFSVFTILPFLRSGFFPIHDDTQVARVFEMAKGLSDGMFPVRWSADLGYGFGYPIFNFYDPLPYYVGAVIEMVGLDALLATKIMMAVGAMLAGVSMYFLAKEFWGKSGGVLSAFFYMYAPYHAVDIYVRGDVAEFWAYAFVPLVFLGLWQIYKEEKWRYVVLTSVSFSLVIVSHNLTVMIISPFLVLFGGYLLFKAKSKQVGLYFLLTLLIGVALAAFYWLPAVLEMSYANISSLLGGGSNFRDNFVCLNQLWTSPWGYGGSVKGCVDGLSFMIGKYHIFFAGLLFVFALTALIFKKYFSDFSREKLVILILAFCGFLISIFFTLQISQPIWELVRPMAYLQYPWRFLLMIVFFASFMSGALFWLMEKLVKKKLVITVILIFLSCFLVLVSIKFFVPQKYLQVNSDYYTNQLALEWRTSKISDEYLPKNFQRPANSNQVASFAKLNSKKLTVQLVNDKTQEITLKTNASEKENVTLPSAYFPSWQGYIDNKQILVKDNQGKIAVNIPQGQHQLKLIFQQTRVELLADLISLVGVLALFAGIIQLKKKYA
ncbi:MAG: 6-pyruvoyl-tetrahydropterin synthase-related protein [Candidatus Levyibacteriota bacterium]